MLHLVRAIRQHVQQVIEPTLAYPSAGAESTAEHRSEREDGTKLVQNGKLEATGLVIQAF